MSGTSKTQNKHPSAGTHLDHNHRPETVRWTALLRRPGRVQRRNMRCEL